MAEQHPEHGSWQRGITRVLAILCACMVLFAATLRLAHSHTPAERESGHCQICITIHTAAPAAALPVQIVLHAAPEPVVTLTPQSAEKIRVETLSDRAPPAVAWRIRGFASEASTL